MVASRPGDDHSLCIQCRGVGHKVADCHEAGFMRFPLTDNLPPNTGSRWVTSSERQKLSTNLSAAGSPTVICSRCMSLDILSWLDSTPPFNDRWELKQECEKRPSLWNAEVPPREQRNTSVSPVQSIFKTLGLAETVNFDSRCGLCRCILYICPTPSSRNQSITLVLSWTAFRLEKLCRIEAAGMTKSSRIVTAILKPFPANVGPAYSIINDGDGLVIAEDQGDAREVSLASRFLCPNVINTDTVREWLRVCTERHPTYCARALSRNHGLTRLIDVETRTIVPYSPQTQAYLTLSYIWGGVDQSMSGAGRIGSVLPKVPQTLEDAMTLTSKLGYRYIWIDSICIDQEDSDDKRLQIAIMNDIYQGSVATIVALSASNANSGLARVSHGKSPPQMSCVVSGVVLRTVGPRLARLVRTSTWYHRAWTFQEGRLSPRCVFVSDDGVYFECNSLQCSEALNTELSAIHLSLKDMNHFNQVSYEEALNIGLTRNPVAIKVIDTGRALSIYSGLARRYSHCKITYPNDRLAAFSGMLKALQAMAYRDGFFWGLPHAHLNWAMAWQARWVTDAQNLYFPSWTWLRHMGGIWPCCPFYNSAGPVPETCPFELEFAYYRTETPAQICKIFSQKYTDMSQDLRHLLSGDPLGVSASRIPGRLFTHSSIRPR